MKILLVTPHSDWSLEAIKSLPSIVKADVSQTGKQAHSKINEALYDVIVVHLETSDTSGAELIRFISSRQIDQKVLIIEGERDFRETGLNEKMLSYQGIFRGPKFVEASEFFKVLKRYFVPKIWKALLQKKAVPETKIHSAEDLTEIDTDTVEFFSMLVGPLYEMPEPGLPRLLCSSGQKINPEMIRELGERNKKYIPRDDRLTWIAYQNELVELFQKHGVDLEILSRFYVSLSNLLSAEIADFGFTHSLFSEIKRMIQNLSALMESIEGRFFLKEIDFQNKNLGLPLMTLTHALARGVSWPGPKTLESLMMSAFFHEVLPVRDKNINCRSDENIIGDYWSHPMLLTSSLPEELFLDGCVKMILEQHHETGDGNGFPLKLCDKKIYPPAKIFGTADKLLGEVIRANGGLREGVASLLKDPTTMKNLDISVGRALVSIYSVPKKISA